MRDVAAGTAASEIGAAIWAELGALAEDFSGANLTPVEAWASAMLSIIAQVMMIAEESPDLYEWMRYAITADATAEDRRLCADDWRDVMGPIRERLGAS